MHRYSMDYKRFIHFIKAKKLSKIQIPMAQGTTILFSLPGFLGRFTFPNFKYLFK